MQNGLLLSYIELPQEQKDKCMPLSTANYMGTNSQLLALQCQSLAATTLKIICSSIDQKNTREIILSTNDDAKYLNLGCVLGWSAYGILSFGCLQDRNTKYITAIIYTIKPSSDCKNPFNTNCKFTIDNQKFSNAGDINSKLSFIGSCANSLSDMFVLLVNVDASTVKAIQYQYIISNDSEYKALLKATDVMNDIKGKEFILSCTTTSVYYILINSYQEQFLYTCFQTDINSPTPTCSRRDLKILWGDSITNFEIIHNTIAYNLIVKNSNHYSLWLGFNNIKGGMLGASKLVEQYTNKKDIPVLHCMDATCAVVLQQQGKNFMNIYNLKGTVLKSYNIQNLSHLFFSIYLECDFIYPTLSTKPGIHYGNIFPNDGIIYQNIGSISKVTLLSDENKLSQSISYINGIVTKAVNYYYFDFDGGKLNYREWIAFLVKQLKQSDTDNLDYRNSLLALYTSLARSTQAFEDLKEKRFNVARGSYAIIKTVPYETYGVNIQGDDGNILVVNSAKDDDKKGYIEMCVNILVSLATTYSTPSSEKKDCSAITEDTPNGCYQQWATYIMGLDCNRVSEKKGCDIPYIYDTKKTGLYFLLPILLQDYKQFYLGVNSLLSYKAPELSNLKNYNSLYGGDKMNDFVHKEILKMTDMINNLEKSQQFAYFYNGRTSVNGECDFDTTAANQKAFRDNHYYTVICKGILQENREGTAAKLYNHGKEPWLHVLFHELTHAKLNTVDKYIGEEVYYGIEDCCRYSDIIKKNLDLPGAEAEKQILIADCITYAAVLPYLNIDAPSCRQYSGTRHMDEESYDYKSKKEEYMKILSQNITCALNVVITNSDVTMTYHLINSLPYQIKIPAAATLSSGLEHNHLTITGPASYSCSQHNEHDTHNDVIINPGDAISTSISLMEACHFVKEWAPPGIYTLTMNNYAKVTVVDPTNLSSNGNTAYTHLLCQTIIENLPGKTHIDEVSTNDL